MNRKDALQLATLWTGNTWARLEKMWPGRLGPCPSVEISARLKTTAGFCYWEKRATKYSLDLFCEYPEIFRMDTIPHELAHQANWDMFRPTGNGCHDSNWALIMARLGLEAKRCHSMINTKHEARKRGIIVA